MALKSENKSFNIDLYITYPWGEDWAGSALSPHSDIYYLLMIDGATEDDDEDEDTFPGFALFVINLSHRFLL